MSPARRRSALDHDEFVPAAFLGGPSAHEALAEAIVERPQLVAEVLAGLQNDPGTITQLEQREAGRRAVTELACSAQQKAAQGLHVEPDELRALLVQSGVEDLEQPMNRPMGLKVLLEVWKEDRRGMRLSDKFRNARPVTPEGAPPV